MVLLYELGIWGARWFVRVSRAPDEAGNDEASRAS
jgi:Sec-independent protein secretion pathway component TatC